jgi:hypothetical protein
MQAPPAVSAGLVNNGFIMAAGSAVCDWIHAGRRVLQRRSWQHLATGE